MSKFMDIPADSFPLVIRILDDATDEVLWEQVVWSEGAVQVPNLHRTDIKTEVWTRDGISQWSPRGPALFSLSEEEFSAKLAEHEET